MHESAVSFSNFGGSQGKLGCLGSLPRRLVSHCIVIERLIKATTIRDEHIGVWVVFVFSRGCVDIIYGFLASVLHDLQVGTLEPLKVFLGVA